MKKASLLEEQSKILAYRPLVVGTLTGHSALERQVRAARAASCDLVEVRLDTFDGIRQPPAKALSFASALLKKIAQETRKSILLTLRSHTESGTPVPRARRLTDEARVALLKPLVPLARLVDLEIRREAFTKKMTSWSRRFGVDVIHSFHDFKTPGHIPLLDRLAALSRRLRGDIFKAAVTPKTEQDMGRFLRWGLTLSRPRSVLIGMGQAGLPSRYIGYSFGSILTYGHLGKTAAPGQIPAGKLAKSVREIYVSSQFSVVSGQLEK